MGSLFFVSLSYKYYHSFDEAGLFLDELDSHCSEMP